MFDQTAINEIIAEANNAGMRASSVLAVAETESAGKVYAIVNGMNEPLIRWEGHYFHKRLKGADLARAVKEGLAHPKALGVKNPGTQAGRYALLERAAAINREAAYESASWGLGQVMGANWKDLGYNSASELVADARSGVAGQVRVMIRFIVKNGLVKALNALDFTTFARRYNGPGYKVNKYDVKMAAAEKRWSKQGVNELRNAAPPVSPASHPASNPDAALPLDPVGFPSAKPKPAPISEAPYSPPFQRIAALIAAAWVAVVAFLSELPCKLTGWDFFCN